MAGMGLPVRFHFPSKEEALDFIDLCEEQRNKILSFGPADAKYLDDLNKYYIQAAVGVDEWDEQMKAEAIKYFSEKENSHE